MTPRAAKDLLYDAQASYPLVDHALGDFDAEEPSAAEATPDTSRAPLGVATLPQTLLRAYSQITGILDRLRESRGQLERTAVDRLTQMNDKLKEVSSATETAATDILNGLDRSTGLMDELDALGDQPESAEHARGIRAKVRDELFGLMVHLQFQDITTQQLAFASSIIVEMEGRLAEIVKVFDPEVLGAGTALVPLTGAAGPASFDPNATTSDASDRQTVADQIFLVKR